MINPPEAVQCVALKRAAPGAGSSTKHRSIALISQLANAVEETIGDLIRKDMLPETCRMDVPIERTRDPSHGDYACTVALALAKHAKMKPREIAGLIVEHLKRPSGVADIEIAGPGFINFHLNVACRSDVVRDVLAQGEEYGREPAGSRESVTIEFVSANPTGPLHVGHGRGAAYGASLGNLLEAHGHAVQREYYVNDNGRQMDILALSIWLRYLELCGERLQFPGNAYQGEYIVEIARSLREQHGDALRHDTTALNELIDSAGDDEKRLDAMISLARQTLGDETFRQCLQNGLDSILDDIRDDLRDFRVVFDNWFSERSLATSGAIDRAVETLRENGHTYESEGALWFRCSELGDDKDRVIIRANGEKTYFASDIAYILNKFERGFERPVYILGADHHGYIARLKAAAQGLGCNPEAIDVQLVQFAHLYRNGEKIPMSTRSGQFVTLRQLREDVGNDAARFFYVMRSNEQHLDFDLDLAKSRSNENPVYYIQYAHARISSVFNQLQGKGYSDVTEPETVDLEVLDGEAEHSLLSSLNRYPEVIERAASQRAPHVLAHYLRELATEFHSYYNATQILVPEANLREPRLVLIRAVQQVLANGLGILGVSAPESM